MMVVDEVAYFWDDIAQEHECMFIHNLFQHGNFQYPLMKICVFQLPLLVTFIRVSSFLSITFWTSNAALIIGANMNLVSGRNLVSWSTPQFINDETCLSNVEKFLLITTCLVTTVNFYQHTYQPSHRYYFCTPAYSQMNNLHLFFCNGHM